MRDFIVQLVKGYLKIQQTLAFRQNSFYLAQYEGEIFTFEL